MKAQENLLDADQALAKKFKSPLLTFQNKAKNQKPIPFDELAMSISEADLYEVRARFGPLSNFGEVIKTIKSLDSRDNSTVAFHLWKYGCELSALNPKQPKMAELWDANPNEFKARFLAEQKVPLKEAAQIKKKNYSTRDFLDLLFLWVLAFPRLFWSIRSFNLAKENQDRQNELDNLKMRREIHKL